MRGNLEVKRSATAVKAVELRFTESRKETAREAKENARELVLDAVDPDKSRRPDAGFFAHGKLERGKRPESKTEFRWSARADLGAVPAALEGGKRLFVSVTLEHPPERANGRTPSEIGFVHHAVPVGRAFDDENLATRAFRGARHCQEKAENQKFSGHLPSMMKNREKKSFCFR
jgi:hypothetical protein